ncbi:HEAT repeat domain-containing protein [Streptomyces sp. CB01881]|uniref:HEAT repeat domain-containing protein n=1 Tax=Streptomyces sp. CB01881 TaxID=2078691 RepID=UPI0011DFCDF1|nr:HEAT repeat domain-containing protein [Streptomyces sp. CB01881]TYC73667.1 hypothetical protein EH183_16540 [Streptomyces sp. CB01881]
MSGWAAYRARVAKKRVAGYIPPTFHLTEADGEEQEYDGEEQEGDGEQDDGEQEEQTEVAQRPYRWLLDQLTGFQPRTYLVDGVAGSGKSSLVTHMAMDLLAAEVACVQVDRNTLDHGFKHLGDPLEFGRAQCPPDIDEPLWKARFKQRRGVFLIDAVNELERELNPKEMRFVRLLLDGSHRYPVLATSRTEPERLGSAGLRSIKRLSIAPLTEGESGGYLRARGLEPVAALKEIRAAGLDGAIWNPLLLSLLAGLLQTEAVDRSAPMPRSRAELLRRTVHRNPAGNHADPAADRLRGQGLHLESVLCAAALVVAGKEGESGFRRNDLRAVLDRVWDDRTGLDGLIEEFLNTQMVAVETTEHHQEQSYRLLHQSIVDFGLALGWQNSSLPPLAFDLDQCVGDWLGLQEDTGRATEAVLARRDDLRPSVLLDVVVANRGRLCDESRASIWRALGEHFCGDRRHRDDLAMSLGRVPFHVVKEGVDYGLLEDLKERDPLMVPGVLESLWNETLTPEHLQQLRRRKLRQEKDQHRAQAEAGAAGEPSEALVATRLAGLADDPSSANRGRTALWLARNRPVEALAPLATALITDPVPTVRGAAAKALGLIGDPTVVPALKATVTGDADPVVRGTAANTLGKLGDRTTVATLQAVLEKDEDPVVRASAATALGRIGDRSGVTALKAALEGDADSVVRGSAANALGFLGDRSTAPALRAVVEGDEDPVVRGSAATALGRLGDRSAVAVLGAAAQRDPDEGVRGSAVHALGRLGDGSAAPVLGAVMEADTNSWVRGAAANALGGLGDASVLPGLRRVVEDPAEDFTTRGSAVWSIGALATEPQLWLIPFAESARGYSGSDVSSARKFRGTIVNLLARQAAHEDVRHWLNRVARLDSDPLNRTEAVRGLAQANVISSELIRFLIDPEKPRSDKRKRDTDNGVLGSAGAAALWMYGYNEKLADHLLPSVARLLTDEATWSGTVNAVLSPLAVLPLDVSQRIIRVLEETAAECGGRPFLERRLVPYARLNEWRQAVRGDMQRLRQRPEEIMAGFRPGPAAAEPADPSAGEFDVAVLTAIQVEFRALLDEVKQRGIPVVKVQKGSRYYRTFTLPGSQGPVRVVAAKATDKGGQAAAALTQAVMADFDSSLLLLVGVAGGFAERGVRLHDVLFGKVVHNYDPERLQADGAGNRQQPYRTDEQLLRLVQDLHVDGDLDDALDGHRLHVKDYASGEKVVAWEDAPLRRAMLAMSTDVYGMETEAHGVLHAVYERDKAGAHVNAGIVKCISDLGDEAMREDKETKQEQAAGIAARVALDVLSHFYRPVGEG